MTDADMLPPSQAVEVFELLGGGQRNAGSSPLLAAAVLPFLGA